MPNQPVSRATRAKVLAGLGAALCLVGSASAAMAACRVTDFTDRTLSSLKEIQRLSFASQMKQSEYTRLKGAAPGSPNHYALIANSADLYAARQTARDKIASLKILNSDDFVKIWASDFLTDDQIRRWTSCSSDRSPGVTFAGRSKDSSTFHLTLTHLTPVGVEKIRIRLVASYNIANIAEFEAALIAMGEHDNFQASTHALRLADPKKRAVVIVRAGYETPTAIYIPVYPSPDVHP